MAEKVDPITGERWRKIERLYETSVFYWLFIVGILLAGVALWWLVRQFVPIQPEGWLQNPWYQLAQAMTEGRGFSLPDAAGQWRPAVGFFPLFPVVLALLMLFHGTTAPVEVVPTLHLVHLLALLGAIVYAHKLFTAYFKPPFPPLLTTLFVLLPLPWLAVVSGTPALLALLFTVAACQRLDDLFKKANEGKLPRRPQVTGAALWAMLALATHPVGLAVAGAFAFLVGRWLGIRRLAWWTTLFLLVAAPWGLRHLYYHSFHAADSISFAALNGSFTSAAVAALGLDTGSSWRHALQGVGLALLGSPSRPTLYDGALLVAAATDHVFHPAVWSTGLYRLFGQLFPLHALAALVCLWGAGLLVFRRSGVLALVAVLWMLHQVLMHKQPGAFSVGPLYFLFLALFFTAIKAFADWARPSRVRVLTGVVPFIVMFPLVVATVHFAGLLDRGSSLFSTRGPAAQPASTTVGVQGIALLAAPVVAPALAPPTPSAAPAVRINPTPTPPEPKAPPTPLPASSSPAAFPSPSRPQPSEPNWWQRWVAWTRRQPPPAPTASPTPTTDVSPAQKTPPAAAQPVANPPAVPTPASPVASSATTPTPREAGWLERSGQWVSGLFQPPTDVEQVGDWLARESKPGDVLLAPDPARWQSISAGRRVMVLPANLQPDTLPYGPIARYWLVDSDQAPNRDGVNRLLRQHPARFILRYQTAKRTTRLWEMSAPPPPPVPAALSQL